MKIRDKLEFISSSGFYLGPISTSFNIMCYYRATGTRASTAEKTYELLRTSPDDN